MKNMFKILFIALVCLSASCSLATPSRQYQTLGGGGLDTVFTRSDIDIKYIIVLDKGSPGPIRTLNNTAFLCIDGETGKPFPTSWVIYVDGVFLTTLNNTSGFYTKDYFDMLKVKKVEIIPNLPTSSEGHYYYIIGAVVKPDPYTPSQ